MILKYIGTSASEEEIVKACGTTELGTTPSQLVKGSTVFGLDADALKYEDIDDLIQAWSALKCWAIKFQKVKQ